MKVSQWILACVALSMLASLARGQGDVQFASPDLARMAGEPYFGPGGPPMNGHMPPNGPLPPMSGPLPAPLYAEGEGYGQYGEDCGAYGECPEGVGHRGWLAGIGHFLLGHGDDVTSHWYGAAETLIYRRDDAPYQNLVFDTQIIPPVPVLTTDDISFTYQPGARLWAGYWFSSGWAVEGLYSSVLNLNSDTTIYGDNNLSLPGDFPLATLDFFMADRMRFDYTTKFYNAEINVVRRWGDVEFLAGFRYVEINERFNIESHDFDTGTSNFHVTTHNQMYGGQIGTRMKVEIGYLGIDFYAKTAVLGNTMDQTNFADDFDGFVLRDASASDASASWLGEIGITGVIPLGAVFGITGGYSVICIDRIALAPGQLDFTDTPTSGTELRRSDDMVLHGFNAGFIANW